MLTAFGGTMLSKKQTACSTVEKPLYYYICYVRRFRVRKVSAHKRLKLFLLLAFVCATSRVSPADITLDTLLHFSFDGVIGAPLPASLIDATGNYNATYVQGADPDSTITYASAAPSSGTASACFFNDNWLNNQGDLLLIPDAGVNNLAGLDFGPLSEFTVEAFIYPASGPGSTQTRRIFSKEIYCHMYLDSTQTLHAIRKWGGGDWDVKYTHLTASSIQLDEWTHIKMTWNAEATGDKLRLHINDILADSAPGTSISTVDSTAGFTVGGYQRADTSRAQFFLGRIDELHIAGSLRDPGEFLTEPHRPVVVDGRPYPAVNIQVDDNGVIAGEIVRLDANTCGPINDSFTPLTVLDLPPLDVTAGQLEKLVPGGIPPGPGRYEFRVTRTGAIPADYHRVLPFTVIETADASRGTPSDGKGMVYRNKKPWLPMIVYVNSRTGTAPDPLLRDRFLSYLEGTPFCMMDYCVPRGGYAYVEDLLNRCSQRSIPVAFHTGSLYYYSDSDGFPADEWYPGQQPLEVIAELTARFRDHPAVAFYYINDELPDSRHDELRAMQTALLRHDPFHPTLAQHYDFDRMSTQADCYDIYVHQFYTGGEVQIRQLFPKMAYVGANMPKPIPFWGNMFLHDTKLRTICYGCIANGAKGLMFYSFNKMWDMYDLATFNDKWNGIVAMGKEIRSRQHLLLQPPDPVQCTVNVDEVATRTVTGNYGTWLLIANAYWQTRSATVTVPSGTVSAIGTDGANYPVSANQFNLTLTPEGVWLIRLFNENENPAAVELPGNSNLSVALAASDILAPSSDWRWTGTDTTPEAVTSYPEPNVMRVDSGPSQRARWVNDANDGFGSVDESLGFTAEIAMRVFNTTSASRGVDFELYIGDGSLPGKRCFITVTTTAVCWYEGGAFKTIAAGLDNFSQMHTYRIAVRSDGIAQIYRDRDLLGVRIADFSIDPLLTAAGPYLQFGDGAASSEADFDVGYIGFDLCGAFDPIPCVVDFRHFARFADHWLQTGCAEPDWCGGADLNHLNDVGWTDLKLLADQWLCYCPLAWQLK